MYPSKVFQCIYKQICVCVFYPKYSFLHNVLSTPCSFYLMYPWDLSILVYKELHSFHFTLQSIVLHWLNGPQFYQFLTDNHKVISNVLLLKQCCGNKSFCTCTNVAIRARVIFLDLFGERVCALVILTYAGKIPS